MREGDKKWNAIWNDLIIIIEKIIIIMLQRVSERFSNRDTQSDVQKIKNVDVDITLSI